MVIGGEEVAKTTGLAVSRLSDIETKQAEGMRFVARRTNARMIIIRALVCNRFGGDGGIRTPVQKTRPQIYYKLILSF